MSNAFQTLPSGLVDTLRTALGADRVVTDAADLEPFLIEERGLYRGEAKVVVLPRTTEEVRTLVEICAEAAVPIVPQGGNTGLVGGAVAGSGEVLISLRRMNRILAVDPINFTMEVEAGAVLEAIHNAADDEDCLFPLSLGSEGSCQIGGNIACNAGGINVLRYGNTRDLVLGLEVVLPDGRVWNGLRSLHKDNSGYALRQIFIGSEGTLGIITRAVLRLYPKPLDRQTAFCGTPSIDDALRLLAMVRTGTGEAISAFEIISEFSLNLTCKHFGATNPIGQSCSWYVLLELTGAKPGHALREAEEEILGQALELGIITDAAIADSLEQAATIWRLRERIPEAEKLEGPSIKHDISLPASQLPQFISKAGNAVVEALKGTRFCIFGHLGDGNLHYNLSPPEGMSDQEFLGRSSDLTDIVHGIVVKLDGSISAEHGIGLHKAEALLHYKDTVELDLMRQVKTMIDPFNIMNPGKIIKIDAIR